MIWVILVIFLLVPDHLSAATADNKTSRDYSMLRDKKNIDFLRNLATMLEAQGFKDVRIIPQMFVATSKTDEGQTKTLIIDYNTLKAFSFDGELPLVSTAKDGQPETAVPGLH